jgi:catechol 2,3-dioxygenase-like lactoylglutathione lyase family enzyme
MAAPAASGVLEAALYAHDLGAAEAFYAGALGLPVALKMEGRHVFFRAGDTVLLVFDPEGAREPGDGPLAAPPHGAEGPGHACLAAPDIDAWKAHLADKGIEIEREIHWPNGARSIYVRDPAGNSLEFAEPKLWTTDPA